MGTRVLPVLLLTAQMSACGGGSSGSSASTQSQTPTNSNVDTVSIAGSPALSVAADQPYSFAASGQDSLGKALTFSISNAPAWATFDSTTGTLSGTPIASQTGTYANIVITASDGTASASLPAFTISVTASATTTPPAANSATVTWVPTLDNTNGTVLTNLGGYYVMYGTSEAALDNVVSVDSATSSVTVSGLTPGNTYYFSVVAFTTQGVRSTPSAMATKTI